MRTFKFYSLSAPFKFFLDFIDLFLEIGKGRERERETLKCGYFSHATGNSAGNPGMCSDWESNW